MSGTTHLKSLQALEMAIREGSLKSAAQKLSITPAAIGQRIRTLEEFLGQDLLVRGRSGLQATPELELAISDLQTAFAALERASKTLDFQRITEIHVVADPDWSELWLLPRLPEFRAKNPNILFCVNGAGDVPMRIGAPDCRIEYGPADIGEPLFTDFLLPVTSSGNLYRIADRNDEMIMEGMPLLHLQAQRDDPTRPSWNDWFEAYGLRRKGGGRGVHYPHARLALKAVRQNVGFLICGLALVQKDLEAGQVVLPFPMGQHIIAPYPYRLKITGGQKLRPQLQKFRDWLRDESAKTAAHLANGVPDGQNAG